MLMIGVTWSVKNTQIVGDACLHHCLNKQFSNYGFLRIICDYKTNMIIYYRDQRPNNYIYVN